MSSPRIFFTADTHLDHAAVLRHCDRPYKTIDDMNAAIVRSWNDTVTSHDFVFVIGDFAWKNHGYWLSQLRGRKIMVYGNHDKMKAEARRNFTREYGDPRNPGIHQTTLDDRYFTLCHFPLHSWNGRAYRAGCLCGHSHGRYRAALPGRINGGAILDVGWDVHGRLLELPDVIKMLDDKLYAIAQRPNISNVARAMAHLKMAWQSLTYRKDDHEQAMDAGFEIDYADQDPRDLGEPSKGLVPLADKLRLIEEAHRRTDNSTLTFGG